MDFRSLIDWKIELIKLLEVLLKHQPVLLYYFIPYQRIMGDNQVSVLDYKYFNGTLGSTITAKGTIVTMPGTNKNLLFLIIIWDILVSIVIELIHRWKKMFSDKKGQVSAELILVTLIFLLIAGSFINLASSGMNKTQTGNLGEVRMLGERIAETVNMVYINGNGYSINLNLPNDTIYKVYVNNSGFINMEYNSQNITIKLIPQSSIQNIVMNNGQKYIVKNNNGTINFTQIS